MSAPEQKWSGNLVPRTRQEAIDIALQWGRSLSHNNVILSVAAPDRRPEALAAVAQADAAEVVRLCALASVLPEFVGGERP